MFLAVTYQNLQTVWLHRRQKVVSSVRTQLECINHFNITVLLRLNRYLRGAHLLMESGRFADEKARALSQVDLSRKGSVDEPIAALVRYINALPAYYTTSSCSGRITAFCLVRGRQTCL